MKLLLILFVMPFLSRFISLPPFLLSIFLVFL